MNHHEKTDWSAYDRKYGHKNKSEYAKRRNPEIATEDAILETAMDPGPEIALASREDLGVMMRMKANRMQQEAALAAIKANLSAQLEVLEHYLGSLVGAKKAKIDLELKAYIAELEREFLRLTAEYDVSLLQERAELLKRVTDIYVAQVRGFMSSNWPETETDMVIGVFQEMRMGIIDNIRANFARRYQPGPA